MSSSRDSTPCPPPRDNDNRKKKGKGPASPATSHLFNHDSSELVKMLEHRLNESHQLLEKLKHNIHHPQQQQKSRVDNNKLKIFSASTVLENQPKIWTASSSSSYKRHSKLNDNKMEHFRERKSQGGEIKDIGIFGSPRYMIDIPIEQEEEPETDETNSCLNNDQADVLSTSATIHTQHHSIGDQARILSHSFLLPRLPELDRAINSWRSRVEN